MNVASDLERLLRNIVVLVSSRIGERIKAKNETISSWFFSRLMGITTYSGTKKAGVKTWILTKVIKMMETDKNPKALPIRICFFTSGCSDINRVRENTGLILAQA